MVAGVPGLVVRLDGHARQGPWYGPYQEPALRRVAARFSGATSGPVAMALASMHRDGRVRERAVAAMVGRPCPEAMPFLVLRTAEWVKPVRDRARAGLALLLADDSAGCLPAVLPMVLCLDARLRGGFAVTQVRAALLSASAEVWRGLLGSGGRRERRFVFDIALAQGWLRLPDLVACSETDPDVGIRARPAEAACREAVWTRPPDVLRRLAESARAEVRVVALTGLVRVGQDGDVAAYLDDDAPLVRAVARDSARRLGIDAREHYRTAVSAGEPALGAIAGLAETGSAADAPLLRPLLGHEQARVRARAVRGLRLLDAVVAGELVPLLRDPSPAVVREATAALRPVTGALPPGLP
jgi:HEAT repeat protein